jgi:hypothetical protein
MISYYREKVKRKTYLKPILLKFIVITELFMDGKFFLGGCFCVSNLFCSKNRLKQNS